jgi:hypothetical protein
LQADSPSKLLISSSFAINEDIESYELEEEILEKQPKDASPLQDSPFICQGPHFLLEQLRPALAYEAICRKEGKMEFVKENTRGLLQHAMT